jgi:hypothetical protein
MYNNKENKRFVIFLICWYYVFLFGKNLQNSKQQIAKRSED